MLGIDRSKQFESSCKSFVGGQLEVNIYPGWVELDEARIFEDVLRKDTDDDGRWGLIIIESTLDRFDLLTLGFRKQMTALSTPF